MLDQSINICLLKRCSLHSFVTQIYIAPFRGYNSVMSPTPFYAVIVTFCLQECVHNNG